MSAFNGGVVTHRSRNHGNTTNYLRIKAGPCRDKYVHNLIAEAKIGRKLLPDETVEHLNGNGLDCSPDNLVVVTRAENSRLMQERLKAGGETAAEPEPGPVDVDTSFDITTF